MIQKLLNNYNYFVEFCFEHGGSLRAHSQFAEMQNELRQELEKLSLLKMTWECPHCGYLTETSFWDLKIIFNGSTFICNNCHKTIVIELYTAQDEEDMESE